ncbi:MAG: zinc-binding dehydrogenase [Bacteroidia bacterium]|nr:zinc-binding dehydrogenase [Bacteroidia bacterium]
MKAYVVSQAGGPDALELNEIPDPKANAGQVLIQIKAFGLNRAEAVTRMGGSGDAVVFPKVIGIECVGKVLDCPGGELQVGQTVAAAMGEMGRKYDGSYAEMTVVPASNVFPIETKLDWTTLAAIPETYFTAWGCCFEALKLEEKPRVVMRPGASALGIAVTQIVNHLGGEVIGVTRSQHKVERLLSTGMAKVIVSGEAIQDQVREYWPEGATGVIDTIVSKLTVEDDLAMLAPGGRLCIAGSLAASYQTEKQLDSKSVFQAPNVSFYGSDTISVEKNGAMIQEVVKRVEAGIYHPHIDSIYDFSQLIEAHQRMDDNQFAGKVVINVNPE